MNKKTRQNYRIAAEVVELLDKAARESHIPKTQIIEDALDLYMGRSGPATDARRKFVLAVTTPKGNAADEKPPKSVRGILKGVDVKPSRQKNKPAQRRKRQ